jgi:hypothetical protein
MIELSGDIIGTIVVGSLVLAAAIFFLMCRWK